MPRGTQLRICVLAAGVLDCVYFLIVATEFFTSWNAIEGLGRGDFRNPIEDLVRIYCIVF